MEVGAIGTWQMTNDQGLAELVSPIPWTPDPRPFRPCHCAKITRKLRHAERNHKNPNQAKRSFGLTSVWRAGTDMIERRCDICGKPSASSEPEFLLCSECVQRYDEYLCPGCGSRMVSLKNVEHSVICSFCRYANDDFGDIPEFDSLIFAGRKFDALRLLTQIRGCNLDDALQMYASRRRRLQLSNPGEFKSDGSV